MKASLLLFLLYITNLIFATPIPGINALSIYKVSETHLPFNLEKRKGGGGGKLLYTLY
jgi:hypothetical protein